MEVNTYVVAEMAAVSAVRGLLALAPLIAISFLARKLHFGIGWQTGPYLLFPLLAAVSRYDVPRMVFRSGADLNQVTAVVSRIALRNAGMTTALFVVILSVVSALRKEAAHG